MGMRLNRSKRKLKKKKLIYEFGIKAAKVSKKGKIVPSSSLSTRDIQNRNSILFKNASKALDFGARLEIKMVGGRNYNLKKWAEMEEEEIEERVLEKACGVRRGKHIGLGGKCFFIFGVLNAFSAFFVVFGVGPSF
ncbi:hypothetical protein RHMOL_Rhmol01G0311900 [Rhododendron molle]|uniref:Uncharacterized protein n=1 Tax=Rhododendron molle TaxID=49168 RepID=A0ACC0Q7C4_RHOML|nr:hypothetical protein RHMOL_Rhmol01G0311900 [Rhododendron molle]